MGAALVMNKRRLCQIDSITIDACTDETHNLTSTVTDHPVEEGPNISDHSRPDPDQVTLACFISNTPLSIDQQNLANQDAGGQPAQTTSGGATQITEVPNRAHQVFLKLKKLRDEGTLIEVVTTLKTYGLLATEGMMITSISIPRNSKNYDGLEFSVTLKQVRIVRNRQTSVQSSDRRVPPKQHKGAKTPEPAETPNSVALNQSQAGTFGKTLQSLSTLQSSSQ